MNLKVACTIQLYLINEVMYNVMDKETTIGLWSRLEILNMMKNLSIKLYFKKQLYRLRERRDSDVGAFKLL